jgi:BirA family biotin operon repressor/biotin-[acetyl-CoA-carboxylase] ligase
MPTSASVNAAVPGDALRAAFAAPLSAPAIAAMARRGDGSAVFDAAAVETVQETGSTNADLLAQARGAAPVAPRLRAALYQDAGRGRLGRRWHAAPGAALLFSLALPFGPRAAPAATTLAAGVAAAEALAARGVEPALKWPNDLLLDGRKLGGVLAELAIDRAGQRTLVIGVGINLWLDDGARGSIDQPAAALAERLPLDRLAAEREALIAALAAAMADAVPDCAARGFVAFQPRFMRRFALLGQAVEVVEQGVRIACGRVLGVDGDGRLLIDNAGRVQAFATGEVSVRLAPVARGARRRAAQGVA